MLHCTSQNRCPDQGPQTSALEVVELTAVLLRTEGLRAAERVGPCMLEGSAAPCDGESRCDELARGQCTAQGLRGAGGAAARHH